MKFLFRQERFWFAGVCKTPQRSGIQSFSASLQAGHPSSIPLVLFSRLGDSNMTHNWMQRAQESGFFAPSGRPLLAKQEHPEGLS